MHFDTKQFFGWDNHLVRESTFWRSIQASWQCQGSILMASWWHSVGIQPFWRWPGGILETSGHPGNVPVAPWCPGGALAVFWQSGRILVRFWWHPGFFIAGIDDENVLELIQNLKCNHESYVDIMSVHLPKMNWCLGVVLALSEYSLFHQLVFSQNFKILTNWKEYN